MGNYIRNGARILFNYALSLILFGVFIYIFMSIAGDNFGKLLPIYSFILFIFAFFIIYSEMKRLAIKERKPQYELNPFPLKGFIYGISGFLPIIVLELISVFISFGDEVGNHLKHIAINTIMGPLFFLIKAFDEKPLGYAAASLLIPAVAMLGYMSGFYNFNIIRKVKKKDEKPVEKVFEKSPWNPSIKSKSGSKKKKQIKKV